MMITCQIVTQCPSDRIRRESSETGYFTFSAIQFQQEVWRGKCVLCTENVLFLSDNTDIDRLGPVPGIFSWDFAADFARLQFPVQSLQSACCQVKAPRINKHKNTNQVRKPPWFHPFATRLLCLSSQHGASSAVKIVAAAEKCCKNACPVHCIVQCPHTAARRSCQCVSYEVRVIDLWTGLEQSTQNNVTWFFSLISFVGAGIYFKNVFHWRIKRNWQYICR